jgi:hypothetical protein
MRLVIAGSRELLVDSDFVDQCVKHFRLKVKEVVSGSGGFVDEAGEEWSSLFLEKEPKVFQANWKNDGNAAGPIRNKRMAEYGDALLLIWSGTSKGSLSMKKEMMKLGKPVYEIILKSPQHER